MSNSHTTQPRKKQKTEKAEATSSCSLSILDPRVWQPLAEGGWLGTQDLGRFLLTTSKAFVAHDEDFIYRKLCWAHWGKDTATALMDATSVPPKAFFRSMAVPHFCPEQDEKPSVPPLKYSPSDYVLMVEMWDMVSGKLLFSEAIPGETVPEYIKTGRIWHYALENPILNAFPQLNGYKIENWEEYLEGSMRLYTRESLKLIRKPDQKVIVIFDETKLSHISDAAKELPFTPPFTVAILYDSTTSRHRSLDTGLVYPPLYERGSERNFQLDPFIRITPGDTWKIDITGFAIDGNCNATDHQFAHVLEMSPEWK